MSRAAGFYEQCDHGRRTEALLAPRSGGIVVSGLVGRPGMVTSHVMRSLAGSDRLSDFDARTVRIDDFLSEIRLDASAELVIWHGSQGSQTVTPITQLLDDSGSVLVIGGPDQTSEPCWSDAVILRSMSLPAHEGIDVVAATALTFAEFVEGDR